MNIIMCENICTVHIQISVNLKDEKRVVKTDYSINDKYEFKNRLLFII